MPCHSRSWSRRESQEMVFEAHERAFRGGVCRRGIYDNMDGGVFVGKKRDYNRRFHDGGARGVHARQKGQVERQVGDVKPRSTSGSCGASRTPGRIRIRGSGKTVWRCSRRSPFLMAYRGPFDGFHAEVALEDLPACADNNQQRGGPRGRATGGRAMQRHPPGREIVAEHPRGFGRGRFVYDQWRAGSDEEARRRRANGAPFIPRSVACGPGCLPATTATGSSSRFSRRWRTGWRRSRRPAPRRLPAAPAAPTSCSARQRQPAPPASIPTPEGLRLRHQPVADCRRYDRLRGAGHGAS